jgi:hypothetical protein
MTDPYLDEDDFDFPSNESEVDESNLDSDRLAPVSNDAVRGGVRHETTG